MSETAGSRCRHYNLECAHAALPLFCNQNQSNLLYLSLLLWET